MPTLLRIESSLYGDDGHSTRFARAISERWLPAQPDGRVIVRDLGTAPLPHLDAATFTAFGVPATERTPAQRRLLETSDALIEELRSADILVLAMPMYNFGVPSALKAYIDLVLRANETFRYTANGPEGLLPGKKAVLVTTRGGHYADSGKDFQLPYVKQVLGFMGIVDLQVLMVEGLASSKQRDASLAKANARVPELIDQLLTA